MSKQTPEGQVKRAITDLLDAERIMYFRMNSGRTVLTGANGKRRMIKGQELGTADILAAPHRGLRFSKNNVTVDVLDIPEFFWIECKRPKGGKQTAAQKAFQERVEAQGHKYMIATSSDDVLAKLRGLGVK